jgi:hypothetical protein
MGVAVKLCTDRGGAGGHGRCQGCVVSMGSDCRWGRGGRAESIACVDFGVAEDLSCVGSGESDCSTCAAFPVLGGESG